MLRASLGAVVCALAITAPSATQEPTHATTAFELTATVPGDPGHAYDAFVGVDDWWDQRHTESPARFVLEAHPGGLFLEQFDVGSSDGAVHARVLWADRGERLVLEGPLGFVGSAVQIVHDLTFEEAGDSTQVTLRVQGHGLFQPGWTEALVAVWEHFLVERYQAFMNGTLGGDGP